MKKHFLNIGNVTVITCRETGNQFTGAMLEKFSIENKVALRKAKAEATEQPQKIPSNKKKKGESFKRNTIILISIKKPISIKNDMIEAISDFVSSNEFKTLIDNSLPSNSVYLCPSIEIKMTLSEDRKNISLLCKSNGTGFTQVNFNYNTQYIK